MHNIEFTHTENEIIITDHDTRKRYGFKPYIQRSWIDHRIREMASEIADYYFTNFDDHGGADIILVSVINGAVGIAKQLQEELYLHGINCEFDTYKVTSRDQGMIAEEVVIKKELSTQSIKDKILIFVEDIIDTGASLNTIYDAFRQSDARAILFVSLFIKREIARLYDEVETNLIAIGREIQKEFIIGCWLDYKQLFRGLPDVWIMTTEESL